MSTPAGAVEVRGIAAGGDGVASLADGRTVFIPRAAPGDHLLLSNVRLYARFARADIAEVLEPGPGRTVPPCPHYVADRCGGCQLMHLTEEAQRAAKVRVAADAVRRLAGIPWPDPPIAASPAALRYRARITMTVDRGRIGYHRIGEADRVFDVDECLLADAVVSDLHRAVRNVRRLLPSDATRLVFRRDRNNGAHLIVRTAGDNAWGGGTDVRAALAAMGVVATLWWHPEGGAPRAVAGAPDPWPATVFEQVNPLVGQAVRAAAIAALGEVSGRTVWDLYAGIGETTAALHARGARVTSVELDRRAVELAERLGPSGPSRHAGRAEAVIARLDHPDAVVANPPRTGMDRAVTDALNSSAARMIAYISCDPATLARDLARLASTYRLAALQLFDQFPQTAHVEALALLERR